ncbi:MAG: hypothetical protein HRT82_17480 [Henriciella sp.]|nr:hypothetical protein [Henriciella sp.]
MGVKQIGYHRPAKRAQAIQLKGFFWFALFFLALLGYAVWATVNLYVNRQYVAVGKAVECVERPSFEYFAHCNALADGPACTLASQSRMMAFYEPIDYACAQFEPSRAFVFSVPNPERDTLEVAEQIR